MKKMCWGKSGRVGRWSNSLMAGVQGGTGVQFGALAVETATGTIQLVYGAFN